MIRAISHCKISGQINVIDNAGMIELIDNCDLSAEHLFAVANQPEAYDRGADVKMLIARINHCRIVCTDPQKGQGFFSHVTNVPTVIKNSVLAGYGRGGIAAIGTTLEVKNCVVINLNDGMHPLNETSAIRIWNEDTPDMPPPTARLFHCVR